MRIDPPPGAAAEHARGFLQGGGEMGALIRAFDWARTSLGPPESWPQGLRTAVRLALTNAHPMLIYWGPDLTCLYNDAYRQTIGPDLPPTSLGRPGPEVWREHWAIIGPRVDLVMRGESGGSAGEDAPPLTGQIRRGAVHWAYSYSPIDDEGRVGGVLVVCTDVTEPHRVSEALRESEERFRLAQEAGGIGAFTVDIASNVLAVTDEFCRVFGVEPAPFLNASEVEALVLAEDQDKVSHADSRARGDVPTSVEYRIRRPDNGEVRWISRRAALLRDESGKPVQLIGVVQDATDRKRVEERLHRLNEHLEREVAERTRERDQVWRNSQDLLAVVGRDGRYLAVNPAWKLVLGFEEHEMIGRNVEDLVHPDDLQLAREAYQHATHDILVQVETRSRHKDGTYRWISWTAAPDAEGVVYANGRHITEMKEQAEALARTEEALRHAQKMEAVGQLTGGIAHDFNNLLTGIMGSLDLLSRRMASGRTQDLSRFIDAAQASASRAAGLTHRLLAFSRRQSLDSKPLAVNRLAAGMEDLLSRTLGENVQLNFVLPPNLWTAEADGNQLENAILNLAINARDAMPEGGTLTIETANLVLDEDEVGGLEGLTPGEYVTVSVSDTGTGMTPQVVARAFDPFFTTKPIGAGTGLGLSMVYGFAKQSRGHVGISSEIGRGATVKLYLPRHAGEVAEAVPEEAPGPAPGAGDKVVLVVEDDDAVRMLVTEVIAELGYQAQVACDATEALPRLHSDEHFDLLVTDVGLPGMNGRQLAELAREVRPDLKVLFITGYAETALVRAGFLKEGMDMLPKPFAIEALAAKLQELIA